MADISYQAKHYSWQLENNRRSRGKKNQHIHRMINNEKLVKEYGDSNIISFGAYPTEYRPKPEKRDYDLGFITRYFSKKVNENRIIEVDPAFAESINKSLYATVNLHWKISGSKDKVIVNGIIDKTGVIDSNTAEIERIKLESGIDLSKKLINKLEFCVVIDG